MDIIKIHPYDFYELVDGGNVLGATNAPMPHHTEKRNYEHGEQFDAQIYELNGKFYEETTTIAPKTTRIR